MRSGIGQLPVIAKTVGLGVLLAGIMSLHAEPAALQLVKTITNPAPALHDHFGESVAAVGIDRVAIGAPNENSPTGAAYLFNFRNELLATFSNPSSMGGEAGFGLSVAAVGGDSVVVGAYHDPVGAAYIFATNGTLKKSLTLPAPSPGAGFGWSLASIGDDRVLFGAPFAAAPGGTEPGGAYLLRTNGSVVGQFASPLSTDGGEFGMFGRAVASVGSDLVLVGAPQHRHNQRQTGAAFLFDLNGVWITTLTNPVPDSAGQFGRAVSGLGTGVLLIADPFVSGAAPNAGAVYLYSTNGAHLLTIPNPDPTSAKGFGISLAAMGEDGFLVGAHHWSGESSLPGKVFAFAADGSMLASVSSPNPSGSDYFGFSVASVGTYSAIVGAPGDNNGAEFAGAVYIFELALNGPRLTIARDQSMLRLVWPGDASGWMLQESTFVGSPGGWTDKSLNVSSSDGTNSVELSVSPDDSFRSFRLRSTEVTQ